MADTPYQLPRQLRQTAVLSGDGVNAHYGPFSFKIFDPVDVTVYVKAPPATEFSIATVTIVKVANQPQDNFIVQFPAVLSSATKFVVSGARLHERTAGITKGTAISSDALEKELSKQGTVLQELRRDIGRAILNTFDGVPVSITAILNSIASVALLGTAAFQNVSFFATAAQGGRADTALQPGAVLAPTAPQGFDLSLGDTMVTIAGGYGAGGIFSVILNGATLEEGPDYTATNGAQVVLASPITVNEIFSGTSKARLLVRVAQLYGTATEILDGGTV